MRMPDVETLEEYRAIYHREDVWRPIIEKICNRHELLDGPCTRGPDGTHIIYMVGRSYVVKLFVPLFQQDFVAERLVGKYLEGKLGIATPMIVAEGEIGGWNYLIMTRVPGRPVGEIWEDMTKSDRQRIAAGVGQVIAVLRSLPVEGLEPITPDWAAFLSTQARTATTRHQLSEASWDPTQEIPAYLALLTQLRSEEFQPTLLLADITREHVLVSKNDGVWEVTSYVDFGDAMVGHPDYELIAPGLDIARGDRDILQALLLAAGYPESTLNEVLRQRLMAYTLMHRYVRLADVIAAIPHARNATGLEELAHIIWPVC
ncbi:MAG: aminoglycoside 3'-phosphotransferase/choline kinase family protein [Anaerolineae bacterium]|nr:aminoglycoside 3'-phosphotransferase/choline kinase family protein [Anaerolineae bacterium]